MDPATKGVTRKVNLRCTHALLAGVSEERVKALPATIRCA